VLLSMDSFYKNLTKEQLVLAHNNDYNFDHPSKGSLSLSRLTHAD